MTSWFDVVDLPARSGALLHHRLLTRCPTATAGYAARLTRRWHFVVATGSFPADLIRQAGGVLHAGPDDWVVASPTRTESDGRSGWVVEPRHTHWRPYQRWDLVDAPHPFRGLIAALTDGRD